MAKNNSSMRIPRFARASMAAASALFAVQGAFGQLTFPIRAGFYYPWYPATWSVAGSHVFYKPDLGYYSSDDQAVVDQHIKAMEYAKFNMAIASWWGPNQQSETKRIPLLFSRTAAAGSALKWAFYYEKEGFGNPTVAQLQSDLAYVKQNYAGNPAYAKVDGKPVIFVYNADDNTCEVADRWAEASKGEWYVGLKVVGNFQNCAHQPSTWHQYGPNAAEQSHKGNEFVIAPGFWRADAATPLLARDPVRFAQNVRNMVKSGEKWQLITTFNEWGEGTAVEGSNDWKSASGFGLYLDALHNDGNGSSIADPRPSHINEAAAAQADVYDLKGKRMATVRSATEKGLGSEIEKGGFTRGIYFIRSGTGKNAGAKAPVKVVDLK
jgi:hypothetical protein